MRNLLTQRGLLDTERLDDSPATATTLSLPGIAQRASCSSAATTTTCTALGLTAGQGVVVACAARAATSTCGCCARAPRTLDQAGAMVDQAETAGSNEDLFHKPSMSGVHYLDVRAFQGQGSYSVTVLLDRDSDTRPDVEDNCPSALNPGQEDVGPRPHRRRLRPLPRRPGQRRGSRRARRGGGQLPAGGKPHPDRLGWRRPRRRVRHAASGCACAGCARRGRKVTLRVTYRPTLLSARAVR